MKIILINLIVNYHMTTITIFITTSTIFIAILLIFIGVENQLGHRPVFRSSCWCQFSFLQTVLQMSTNFWFFRWRPGSNAVLNTSRIEFKWETSFLPH